MKKLYFSSLCICISAWSFGQIVNIPDANFKAKLLSSSPSSSVAQIGTNYVKIDTNNDGEIQVNEATLITLLDVSSSSISSLEGVTAFNNLQTLRCSNNNLQNFEIASLPTLQNFDCSYNQFTAINVTPQLRSLNFAHNQISTLDLLGDLNQLIILNCSNNLLTELSLLNVPNLRVLYCSSNQLSALDVVGLAHLVNFSCDYNQITTLDVSNKPNLSQFHCWNNQLTSLVIANVPNLYEFNCSYNLLTALIVPPGNFFETFDCSHNLLTALDLTNETNDYWWLDVSYNQLTNFVVPRMSFDGRLFVSGNLYTSLSFLPNSTIISFAINDTNLVSLDLSTVATTPIDSDPSPYFFTLNNNPNLQTVNIKNGQQQYFTSLYISNNPVLTSICADANEVASVESAFGSNVTVSSDCTLGNQDFAGKQVTLTPNPTSGILNVNFETGTNISDINIYNPLGQLVKTLAGSELSSSSSIDVTALKTGTYLMEINSNQGKTTKKFIKL